MQDLHPFLVHFPVAIIPVTVILGLYSLVQRRNRGVRHAFRLCLFISIVSALGALLTGQSAEDRAVRLVPPDLLEAHEELGTLTFWLILAAGVFELISLLRRLGAWATPLQALAFVLTVAAVISTALAGHRGAEMVYRFGAGVGTVFEPSAGARLQQTDTSLAQPASVPPAGGE
jgi:uncharacterized membrane protein